MLSIDVTCVPRHAFDLRTSLKGTMQIFGIRLKVIDFDAIRWGKRSVDINLIIATLVGLRAEELQNKNVKSKLNNFEKFQI